MALDADQLQQRYEEIRSYIGWTEADQCRVRNVRPVLEPRLSSIVDAFYAEIQSFPSIAHLLSGGPKQIERLKGTLTDWLRDLFESPHDAAYRARHFRAGRKHVEIGLEQFYVNGGLSRIRSWLIDALFEQASEVAELAATIDSLNRALDLDLTLIDLAYHDAAMSAQEHVAEQLRTALVAADAGSRSKSAFLANMSHEVRSPINAIIGMTDLVLGTPLTAEQRDRLTIVQDSSEALLSLINDILDYSRIEQNR